MLRPCAVVRAVFLPTPLIISLRDERRPGHYVGGRCSASALAQSLCTTGMSILRSPVRRIEARKVQPDARFVQPARRATTMRFLCLYRPAAGENGPPPRAEDFVRMGAFIEDLVKTG